MLLAWRAAFLLFKIFSLTLTFMGSKVDAQQDNELSNQAGFSIYCNSNMDATGNCSRSDNGNPLLCIVISGQVIDCSDQNKREFDCVQYGALLPLQTQFFCMPDKSKSTNEPMIDSNPSKTLTPLSIQAAPYKRGISQTDILPAIKNSLSDYDGNQPSIQQEIFQNVF